MVTIRPQFGKQPPDPPRGPPLPLGARGLDKQSLTKYQTTNDTGLIATRVRVPLRGASMSRPATLPRSGRLLELSVRSPRPPAIPRSPTVPSARSPATGP